MTITFERQFLLLRETARMAAHNPEARGAQALLSLLTAFDCAHSRTVEQGHSGEFDRLKELAEGYINDPVHDFKPLEEPNDD